MKVEYKYLSRRSFGVEIEVSNNFSGNKIGNIVAEVSKRPIVVAPGWSQTRDNCYWHIKKDSTCGPIGIGIDNGWEVASFKASGEMDLRHIGHVVDNLYKRGVELNKNCGLHVHVGIEDFNTDQAAILMARWLKIERLMCNLVPEHRINNRYCRLLSRVKRINRHKRHIPSSFWRFIRPTDLRVHDNNQKKVALNLVNYTASVLKESMPSMVYWPIGNPVKTVELRLPDASLSGRDVMNWVRIFISFVDASYEAKMPKTLKSVLELDGLTNMIGITDPRAFCLLSNGYLDAKKWLFYRVKKHGTIKNVSVAIKKLNLMKLPQK